MRARNPLQLAALILSFGSPMFAFAAAGAETGPLAALAAEGAKSDPSVRETPGREGVALLFSDGAIEVPMAGRLTAGAGSVELRLRTPGAWPPTEDCALFHIGEQAHVHITLFFRGGGLIAVYKGGEEHYSSTNYPKSRQWAPASWHRVEFSWDGQPGARTVNYQLRVDGALAGQGEGWKIDAWPARFFIGARGPKNAPWQGAIEGFRVSPTPLKPPEATPLRRAIEVRADRVVGECHNFWSIHNFTSEDMFADPAQRKLVEARHPFMKYVNCVRFIGGRADGKNEYFQGVGPDGKPRCDFAPMLSYLRGMLDWGYTPRIVLDNVPMAMSQPKELHTYGNTDPPKDYELYHAYIEALTRAMVGEFGLGVVGKWRFRVMTEPDLYPGHWSGTKEEYLRLYDYAVDAVTRVIPDADIGPGNVLNPAGGEGTREKWGLDIIDHAATGRNYRTGKTGTRLRYISCSWYGRVGRTAEEFETAVRMMRERLEQYPQFRGLPVEVAEFSVLTDEAGRRLNSGEGTEWAASWLASVADRAWRLNVAQIHQWATTSASGLWAPYTHVLWMLEQMTGGERLEVEVKSESSEKGEKGEKSVKGGKGGEVTNADREAARDAAETPADGGAIACRKDGRLFVLLYNHRGPRKPAVTDHVTLRIRDPRLSSAGGAAWTISEWRIDAEHGGFLHALYEDCAAAGIEPLPGSPLFGSDVRARFGDAGGKVFADNREKYAKLAQLHQARANEPLTVGDGEVTFEFTMPAQSVRFLELAPSAERK